MKTKIFWPIVLILFMSFAFNMWGIGHDMPYCYEHDELNFVMTALSFGKGNLDPGSFIHGSFLYYFLFLQYAAFFLIKLLSGSVKSAHDFISYYLTNPTPFFLIGRISTAIFSTVSIYLTYLIGKRIGGRRLSGVLASLFLGTSLLYVNMSHLVKEDIFYVFFMLLSFLSVLKAAKNNKFLYLSGFLIGFALSVKYLSVLGLIFVFFGFVTNGKSAKEMIRGLVIAGCFAFAGFVIGQPYGLMHIRVFLEAIFGLKGHIFDKAIGDKPLYASWYMYLVYLKRSFGIYILAAFLLSFLNIFNKVRARANILLLPFILVYFFFISRAVHTQPSYLMGILPFICIYTSIFISDLVTIISGTRQRLCILISTMIGFLLVAPSLMNSLRYDFLLTKPDTRAVSKKWIEENIPANSTILIESAFPREIVHAPAILENKACLEDEIKAIKQSGGSGIFWGMKIKQLENSSLARYYVLKDGHFGKGALNKYSPEYIVVSSYYDHGFWVSKNDRQLFYNDLLKNYSLIKNFEAMPYIVWFPSFCTLRENPENLRYVDMLLPDQNLMAGPNIAIYQKKLRK